MEQKDRLALAMSEAGYDNPTEAWRANERALGISKDLLISNNNGHRPISKKSAVIYSRVFGHTPGWYLYGTEEGGEAPRKSQTPTQRLNEAKSIVGDLTLEERTELLAYALSLPSAGLPAPAPDQDQPQKAGPKPR